LIKRPVKEPMRVHQGTYDCHLLHYTDIQQPIVRKGTRCDLCAIAEGRAVRERQQGRADAEAITVLVEEQSIRLRLVCKDTRQTLTNIRPDPTSTASGVEAFADFRIKPDASSCQEDLFPEMSDIDTSYSTGQELFTRS
jgi:hypothetical protein